MTALIDYTRRFIESEVEDLRGEKDFMPFMIYTTAKDENVYVGLAAMGEPAERDGMASSATGMLAVYRATEAVFASCSWMANMTPEERDTTMPSEHPNRREEAFILHVDPEGKDHFHSAAIHRIKGRVTLGAWRQDDEMIGVGGRFARAIHLGIELGKELPPEMIAFIDAHIESEPQRLIEGFSTMLNQLSGGAQMDLQFFTVPPAGDQP